MSGAIVRGVRSAQTKAPFANFYDVPELMPGAKPKATQSQKLHFEQRCQDLHRTAGRVEDEGVTAVSITVSKPLPQDLEAMFPSLDGDLVRTLVAEAQSMQQAVELLLALSAATCEPSSASSQAARPERDIGLGDSEQFPSLLGHDAFQSIGHGLLCAEVGKGELGSAWRDCAKAAAQLPGPKPLSVLVAKRGEKQQVQNTFAGESHDDICGFDEPLTDYELRHLVGEKKRAHVERQRPNAEQPKEF